MELQNSPNKLSRRNWLRDAAIATTGAALMPSLLTSCSDHRVPPGVGVGGPGDIPLSEFDLYSQAAGNLARMAAWTDNIRIYTIAYEQRVFELIKGGQAPTNWKNILVEVFTDIGIGLLQAALAEFPGAGPAIAIAVKQIEKWGLEEKKGNVNTSIEAFRKGYDDMQYKISTNLLNLARIENNFGNLREAFRGGDFEFNGKKYSLQDLARNRFPQENLAEDAGAFADLREAAYLSFQKYIWNAMFIYAGEMRHDARFTYEYLGDVNTLPRNYAIRAHYPNHKATYLRGEFRRGAIASNPYFYYHMYTCSMGANYRMRLRKFYL